MKYLYVDPNEGLSPAEALRTADPGPTYIVPYGRPWSRAVRTRLVRKGCHVLPPGETIDQADLQLPPRPPWVYLESIQPFTTGGMSVLYHAVDCRDGSMWVLKVVAYRNALDLDMNEAILARRSIRGLFPVRSSAVVGGDLLILMPKADQVAVPGSDQALSMIDSVARSLASIHEAGWVHCDVKPSNILIRKGTAYLADPGISTRTGMLRRRIRCSLRFAPPEWLAAFTHRSPVRILPSADIFALGVTAVHLFSGQHPLEGLTDRDILLAHSLGRCCARLQRAAADLPMPWSDCVHRALDSDPAARPTIDAFLSWNSSSPETFKEPGRSDSLPQPTLTEPGMETMDDDAYLDP